MGKKHYTKEQNEWLINNRYNYTNKELVVEFEKRFNCKKNKDALRTYCTKCLNLPAKIEMFKYTKEQDEWLMENRQNYNRQQLTKLFNEKFNCNLNWDALSKHMTVTLKLYRKNIGFKALPINTITTDSSNRVRIKTNDAMYSKIENWELLSHHIWKKHYGEVPKGYKIIFLDGNKNNFDINNLRCVSPSTMTKLGRRKWYGKDVITQVGIKCCELEELLSK